MRFPIHVSPRSKTNEVTADPRTGTIRVRVTAAPESGRANEAVLAILGRRLGLRAGSLRLVGGASSRRKWVEAEGIEVKELWRRLGAE